MKLVNIFKLLGEETRLRIVNLLFVRRICVCELQDVLGISQVSASKHLAKLRQFGMVSTTKEGQRVYYSLVQRIREMDALGNLIAEVSMTEPYVKDLASLDYNDTLDHIYVCPTERRS